MRLKLALSLLLISLLIGGCIAPKAAPGFPSFDNRLHADHAPTPYSADQIREATPTGSQVRFLVGAPGAQALGQIMTFTQPTAETVDVRVEIMSDDGKSLGEPSSNTMTWASLQSHASFPEVDTTVERLEHETKLGTSECWRYTVVTVAKKVRTTSEYWFDVQRPGPPIELTQTRGGEIVFRMEMIEDTRR